MQWNPPFGTYGFQNNIKTAWIQLSYMYFKCLPESLEDLKTSDLNKVFHIQIEHEQDEIPLSIWEKRPSPSSGTLTVPPNPQIIGEGDVIAITFPDGSLQCYFMPVMRHDNLPDHCNVKLPFSNLFSWPCNTEAWFVRSITHPQTNTNISVPRGYFNGAQPKSFGECPLMPYLISNYCGNTPTSTYPQYTQKFHNDKWSSTTDIHYFYPSLRRELHIQYCTETQTEIPFQNNIFQNNERNRPGCHCKSSSEVTKQPVTITCACYPAAQTKSSVSCMSVDSERSRSEHRKNKKYKKQFKYKKTSKRDHFCECKAGLKNTSDKLVTTYADKATGNVAKDGRETQTIKLRSKRDTKSDIWAPERSSILKIAGTCQSCSNSGSCTCRSTSGTDGE